MKKLILLCLILITSFTLKAQSLSNQVVACFGNFTSAGNYSLSSTMGELMSQTYNQSNYYLTQGFQQPDFQLVGVQEFQYDWLELQVYPNPTSDKINLIIYSQKSETFFILITGILGQNIISTRTIKLNNTSKIVTFNLDNLNQGIYFLNVYTASGFIYKTFKIVKN